MKTLQDVIDAKHDPNKHAHWHIQAFVSDKGTRVRFYRRASECKQAHIRVGETTMPAAINIPSLVGWSDKPYSFKPGFSPDTPIL
jgi:hypothetical protein